MTKTVYVVMGPEHEDPAVAVFTNKADAQRALDIDFGGGYVELVIDEHVNMVNAELHHYEVSGDMDSHTTLAYADFTFKELRPFQLVQASHTRRWHLKGIIEATEQQDAINKVKETVKRIKAGEAPEIELIHAT